MLAVALATALVSVVVGLRRSLPRDRGTVAMASLAAPVVVEFDSLGVPQITGGSIDDVVRAQGFVHAQERFFQMDLARRAAAGELAALVGAIAIPSDREARRLGARRLAEHALAAAEAPHRTLLLAYAAGVNAGLADLRARPPEYLLLRATPEPWRAEDTFLVLYYFFTGLSFNHRFERALQVMRTALPTPVTEFLTPSTSRFDRPLLRSDTHDPTGGYLPAPVPPAAVVDLRAIPRATFPRPVIRPPLLVSGSNNWVVAGRRSAHGGAVLANDTHLPLGVPNAYYRVELHWGDRTARGLSIAGAPGVILGASDDLAWGATNALADQTDLVVVEVDPGDSSRYRVPGGTEPFERRVEHLAVRGANPLDLEVTATRWGPLVERDWRGRPLALRSTAHDPNGMNVAILDLLFAHSVAEAMSVLDRWGGPALNWLLADRMGAIGWVVSGPLPARAGDGSAPASWALGAQWLGRRLGPRLLDPPDGWLVTANNRTVHASLAAELGRAWMSPARAYRIAELLRGTTLWNEHHLLAMQLDTRAPTHDVVRELVLEVVSPETTDTLLAVVRRHAASWNGTADADQPGFRLLQAYYVALHEAVLGPLLAPAVALDSSFVYNWPLADEPLRRILEERPGHLLPAGYGDWPAFLRAVLEETTATIAGDPAAPALDAPWGEVNRAAIRHPLSFLPFLGPRLNMPSDPLSGWANVVRASAPSYGAAVRFVVSPGLPDRGLLQTPGGQSGHFLSPHYRDAQRAWVQGLPARFTAGPTRTRYLLEPQR